MQLQLTVARTVGGTEQIVIEAESAPAAVRLATGRGYRVLAVAQAEQRVQREVGGRGAFSLVLFNQELMALLDAGLTVIESLQTLRKKAESPTVANLLDRLLTDLRQGRSFSDALAASPEHFPELYVAAIRASERSGNLPDALSRYIVYQLQFDVLKKKLITAAIYPSMLLSVGLLVTLFLVGYVVPRFSAVYEGAGRQIPWLSGVLLAFGRIIFNHWETVAALVILAAFGLLAAVRTASIRQRLLDLALHLPALGRRAAAYRLARFYRTLSLLLDAGIPLVRAMTMTAGLFSGREAVRLADARRAVEEGQPFSQALERHGLATPIALSLLTVGEKSGRLSDMLERAARFHDEEFSRWMDWASRLLEPLLMAVMGVLIGGVVVLLYIPIFDLASSLR